MYALERPRRNADEMLTRQRSLGPPLLGSSSIGHNGVGVGLILVFDLHDDLSVSLPRTTRLAARATYDLPTLLWAGLL